MKPMLLCRENPDTAILQYPVMASPKLDGIRCLLDQGKVLSRTLKQIPNDFVRSELGSFANHGLDGELIVGDPAAHDVYRTTNSAIMSIKGEPDFRFYAFDFWNDTKQTYIQRQAELEYCFNTKTFSEQVVLVPSHRFNSEDELLDYEQQCLALGYEGIIIRGLHGKYKYGRTTMKEHNAYKLKRMEQDEAIIVDVVEEMANLNEAKVDALGHTERSSHKENLVGKGTMGALVVENERFGRFNIGTGFDAAMRLEMWVDKPRS